jgi:hypothetical protein
MPLLELGETSLLDDVRKSADNWAAGVEQKLKASLSIAGTDTGAGVQSIDHLTNIVYGDSVGIWFGFLRYLVMVEKGAGRGHAGKKGSRWRSKDGKSKKTNPASFGKMGKGSRKARPWFNPVLRREIEELANVAAEEFSIQSAKFLIK